MMKFAVAVVRSILLELCYFTLYWFMLPIAIGPVCIACDPDKSNSGGYRELCNAIRSVVEAYCYREAVIYCGMSDRYLVFLLFTDVEYCCL